MPYIIGLLGVLAAAGIWIYRINAAARGAQELADIAGEAANLPRKWPTLWVVQPEHAALFLVIAMHARSDAECPRSREDWMAHIEHARRCQHP